MAELPEGMTVEEAAKYLRIKRSTFYELVKKGVIPLVKLGRQIRILRSAIENLFKVFGKGMDRTD